jgi:hypothetical protein
MDRWVRLGRKGKLEGKIGFNGMEGDPKITFFHPDGYSNLILLFFFS